MADQDEGGARFGARIIFVWARLAAGYVPPDERQSREHLVLLEEENGCGAGQEQRLVSRQDTDKKSGLATALRARRVCSSTHTRARERVHARTHARTHAHTRAHTPSMYIRIHTKAHNDKRALKYGSI